MRTAGPAHLEAFRRVDDGRALASIAIDYATVLVTAGLASWIHRVPTTLLAMVIIAGRQSALQGLVHAACHYCLFSDRRRNDRLQFLFAYPILDSVPLYRAQHLAHHRDFERRTADRFDYLCRTLDLCRRGVWHRTWAVFVRPLLGHAGCVFLADQARTLGADLGHAVRLVTYWVGLVATAWWLGWLWPFLLYWVVPLVWLYPVLDIWAELSDHLEAAGESRNQEGMFYSLLLKGHEMYHAVHHLYPAVPYYRLRELRDSLQQRGVVMEHSRGPLDFLRIVYRSAPESS